ncbi:MAG: hypothetical protein ABW007_19190 [Chitinophagaceae bacterium]
MNAEEFQNAVTEELNKIKSRPPMVGQYEHAIREVAEKTSNQTLGFLAKNYIPQIKYIEETDRFEYSLIPKKSI